MPSANTKLSVSGIGEFKSAMQQARTATRTLDSEMKLAQAQFKATGDAQAYLEQRSRILANQMAQQEKAAQAARDALARMDRDGVQTSEKSYQDMQRALYDAEREMVRLRQEADKTGEELLDTGNDADKMGKSLESIAKSSRFSAVLSGIKAVGDVVEGVVNKITQLGKKIYSLESEAGTWADSLITKSRQYGLSTDELQRYEYASRFVDTEVDSILRARDRLMQKTHGEGALFLVDGIKQYGIALQDEAGKTRDSMEVFWDFVEVLGRMENATDRDTLAQEYFGRSFRELQTLIQAGREGWNQYMQEAEGALVSEKDVETLGQMDDTMQRLQAQWQKTKYQLAADFAPAFERIVDKIVNLLESDKFERLAGLATSLMEGMADAFEWLADKVDELFLWLEKIGIISGYSTPTYEGGSFTEGAGAGRDDVARIAEERAKQAGENATQSFASGATETAEAAYAAGAALGAATIAGFAANAGGGGSVTNNNSTQNFGDTYNIYGNSAEDAAAAARRQAAGYGG